MRHVFISARATAVLLFAAAATILVASPAAAADPATDFSYTLSGSDATIMGYVGGNTVVDIPATILDGGTTYTVTTIGSGAFRNKGLTAVTIPNTVTTIEDSAFRLNSLTSITIPNSVTTIDTYAFYNNALTSLVIPSSLTAISNNAFRANALTSVTIPNSVTAIGNNSFAENSALASITIPSSVTSMGNGTFASDPLTSTIFAGAAPAMFTVAGATGSLGTGAGLTVYYYAGATGFSSSWNGYAARAISAAVSDLAFTPAGPVTVGTTPYTVTVTVRDDTHSPVAGVPVAFTVPAGVTASATGCVTATDGTCLITVASTTAASYALTAKVGADPAVLSQSLTFVADPSTTSGGGTGAAGTGPVLAATGTNLTTPLVFGGSLFTLGLALLASILIRRKRALR